MGWNQVRVVTPSPLFAGVSDGDHFYFVHKLRRAPRPVTLAATDYGGEFSAAVHHGNFHGVQFHPERSGTTGRARARQLLELR